MKEPTLAKITQKKILRDPLMWRFRFYGFFKNLRFFEPYLLIMLLVWGLNLFQIGLLILVQEVFTYLFEIPSGILADKFGKKNELLFCFGFYIVSFGLYFVGLGLSRNFFFVLFIAAAFFGLGEAFRSGTHKAMILAWMDKKNYQEYKTFVYGRTRSWSLIGSSLNGIVSIFLILAVQASQWVFIMAIVPYFLDFILIATYPSYMNEHTPVETTFFKEMGKGFKEMFLSFKKIRLLKGILSTSSYDAVYKSIKDYIQPIIKFFIVAIIISFGLESTGFSNDDLIIIFLGVMYSVFYIFSSISSMNAYRIKNWLEGAKKAMDILYYLFAGILLLISIFIWRNLPIVVIFIFLFIYVFENIRRPLGVDYLGDLMKKDQRATMLSVEAQIKSFLVFIFAPLFGRIADYSIPLLFGILAGSMVITNLFLQGDKIEKSEPATTHNQK